LGLYRAHDRRERDDENRHDGDPMDHHFSIHLRLLES
jgi:hypothetical protein